MIILILLIIQIKGSLLTPLSKCTKARITAYEGWEEGGNCYYGKQSTKITDGYMFGAVPNEAYFGGTTKCGICYEMVGPSGTLRFRVDGMCNHWSPGGWCNGCLIHFDLS